MSKLVERKTRLTFETADAVREQGKLREVIIEAHPGYALVRLKGMRKGFPITFGAIYHHAARIEVERLRAEKKARKR